nr:immunoglobulin heavy chain junction region [Mus musculus]
CARTAGAYW